MYDKRQTICEIFDLHLYMHDNYKNSGCADQLVRPHRYQAFHVDKISINMERPGRLAYM